MNDKLSIAQEAAKLIKEAADKISEAVALMEANGLSLNNYPDYWHDFNEHPVELENLIVSDFEDIDVQVGN